MDKERLGKILGAGARSAAKTAYQALDAAIAPDPKAGQKPVTATRPVTAPPAAPQTPRRPAAAQDPLATAVKTVQAVHEGKKRMKQAALAPIKKAGRTLALEIFGSFFLLFGIAFALNAWKHRAGLHMVGAERNSLYTFAALTVLFLYFGISSFVRARRS